METAQPAAIMVQVLLLWTTIVTTIVKIAGPSRLNPLLWGSFAGPYAGLTPTIVLIVPAVKQKVGTNRRTSHR